MRDYDPTTGRYLQADPLGLIDGASVYGYRRGDPGRYTDPTGMFNDVPWPAPRPPVVATPSAGSVIRGGIGALGGTALGAIGLILAPSTIGDGTFPPGGSSLQGGSDDCCRPIYQQINERIKELKSRAHQWAKNRSGSRPGEILWYNHVGQFFQKQKNLEILVARALAARCYFYNPEADYCLKYELPFAGRAWN